VVLAGGAGTRFWPASRRARPKPFVPLVGSETLFEQTLVRARRFAPAGRTWVVGAESHRRLLAAALRGRRGVTTLLEPSARNTAAAIAWAAAEILGRTGRGTLAVLPADHHVPNAEAFARTIRRAAALAGTRDALVLLGIEPTRPDTAYGYLRVAGRSPLAVRRFVEKPDAARARRYLRSGGYLWNSGIVVAPARRILDEVRTHAPEVWRSLGGVLETIAGGGRVARRRLAAAYRGVRSISFDHAVLERTGGVLALRGRFAWSDLGSWDALREHLPRVAGGNRVHGASPVLLDARDNLVFTSTGRTLALLGVEGLLVVDTPDATLVCAPDRAQDVRRLVDALSERGKRRLT
jgi:mannose-1-phosphate guanylyltransferase